MYPNDIETAGIVHDIRNLLLVISANCSILTNDLPDAKCSSIHEIAEASDVISSLLFSLGDLRFPPQSSMANVRTTVETVVEFGKTIYPSVEFRFSCEELNFCLDMCPEDLFRLMLNLIFNAAEAASEVDSPEVQILVSDDKRRLNIIDNGLGFKSLDTKAAFAPFVTSRGSSTTKHEGLGLYVAESITGRNGESISIRSEEGSTSVEIHCSECPGSCNLDELESASI